ncbi:hypothetical protein BJ508DRAFT_312140 [Ascobolus immersus RN42]|uniref:Uncharacterized protein n=1 Tax=Ascobolus immersus RN42 TaxID=1160509 RepID=A0A3N4HN32_ASCIM|nr:hypothetical protein BJ508DRAFT_312140 [Ascobolus immersus RN42]
MKEVNEKPSEYAPNATLPTQQEKRSEEIVLMVKPPHDKNTTEEGTNNQTSKRKKVCRGSGRNQINDERTEIAFTTYGSQGKLGMHNITNAIEMRRERKYQQAASHSGNYTIYRAQNQKNEGGGDTHRKGNLLNCISPSDSAANVPHENTRKHSFPMSARKPHEAKSRKSRRQIEII